MDKCPRAAEESRFPPASPALTPERLFQQEMGEVSAAGAPAMLRGRVRKTPGRGGPHSTSGTWNHQLTKP